MYHKIITRKELANLLEMNEATLRTWLAGYRFTKFMTYKGIEFSKDFVNEMSEYLKLKRRHGLAKYLIDFYKKNSCK